MPDSLLIACLSPPMFFLASLASVLPGEYGRGGPVPFGVLGLESGVWFDMSGATSGEEVGEKASIRQGRLGLLGQRVLLVWLELAS